MAGVDAARFRDITFTGQRPQYGDARYWDARYSGEGGTEVFDWYLRWEQLRDILLPLLVPEGEPEHKGAEVLILGCGTSGLGEALYAEGFSSVTNVDRCAAIVEAMREKHESQLQGSAAGGPKGKKNDKGKAPSPEPDIKRTPMSYVVADASDLPRDWVGKFDLVIDKAMLDAVACGADKWAAADSVIRSVRSVLKPGSGIYFVVSHAGPEVRGKMLVGPYQGTMEISAEYRWSMMHQTLPRPLVNPAADPKAKDKFELTTCSGGDEESNAYHIYVCKALG